MPRAALGQRLETENEASTLLTSLPEQVGGASCAGGLVEECVWGEGPMTQGGTQVVARRRRLCSYLLEACIVFVTWEARWPVESATVEGALQVWGDQGSSEKPSARSGHVVA